MYEKGWLDKGFKTLGNISPFIFTVIPFTFMMRDKVKEFAYSAIAFLWFGMFLAMFFATEYSYLVDYHTEATLVHTGEALCHMLAALFGIYLILTQQVKLDFKRWVQSLIFMYSAILFGVFLNYVFRKGHFGMDPYGNYGIYMIDIFGTFEATFIAYLLGVLVVLTLGMQTGALLMKLSTPKHAETMELPDLKAEKEEILSFEETAVSAAEQTKTE